MKRRVRHSVILRLLAGDEAGAALVEFSIMAPFLFALAFGMSEFGRFFYHYQLVLEGLRDAGRYLARVDPTDEAHKTNAKNLATTGTIEDDGEERVSGWTADNITIDEIEIVDESVTDYRGTPYVIRVSTTFNYADVGFLSALGLSSLSVSAAHEQRVIDRAGDIDPPEEEE